MDPYELIFDKIAFPKFSLGWVIFSGKTREILSMVKMTTVLLVNKSLLSACTCYLYFYNAR